MLFVEADGEVVWDRATRRRPRRRREAGRVREPRRLRAPFFTARAPHAWHGHRRAAGAPPARPELRRRHGRVLTWNTLWDRYDRDRIDTARRRPLLLDALDARRTPTSSRCRRWSAGLLTLLLAAPWVRAAYTLGTDPAGRDIPTTAGPAARPGLPEWRRGGPVHARPAQGRRRGHRRHRRRAAHGRRHPPQQRPLARPATRRDATRRLAEGRRGWTGELLLVGDFNDGGGPTRRRRLGMTTPGARSTARRRPTFDPAVNPLAAVSSLSGRASRLDRVLLRPERPARPGRR